MGIERSVVTRKPKYEATVTVDATRVVARVEDGEVLLSRPGARAILRIPLVEWIGFRELVVETQIALMEQEAVTSAVIPLPWEQPNYPDPAAGVLLPEPIPPAEAVAEAAIGEALAPVRPVGP